MLGRAACTNSFPTVLDLKGHRLAKFVLLRNVGRRILRQENGDFYGRGYSST